MQWLTTLVDNKLIIAPSLTLLGMECYVIKIVYQGFWIHYILNDAINLVCYSPKDILNLTTQKLARILQSLQV